MAIALAGEGLMVFGPKPAMAARVVLRLAGEEQIVEQVAVDGILYSRIGSAPWSRHRFYTGSWVRAGDLRKGDAVFGYDGRRHEVGHASQQVHAGPVYNLRITRQHNYYVGHNGLLVHNDKVDTPSGSEC